MCPPIFSQKKDSLIGQLYEWMCVYHLMFKWPKWICYWHLPVNREDPVGLLGALVPHWVELAPLGGREVVDVDGAVEGDAVLAARVVVDVGPELGALRPHAPQLGLRYNEMESYRFYKIRIIASFSMCLCTYWPHEPVAPVEDLRESLVGAVGRLRHCSAQD